MTTVNDQQTSAADAVTRLTGPGGPFELVTEDVLGSPMPVYRHRNRALHEILAESVKYGDHDYLVTATSRLSFVEHGARVSSLAKVLREEYGVTKGDRVAIAAANSPQWLTTFWATVSIGAVAVGFNAWWSARELDYGIRHSCPKLLVADTRRAALLGTEPVVPVLQIETDIPAMSSRYPAAPLPSADVAEDDPAVIIYTSGTSGRPKGALHSQRNLLAVIDYHRLSDVLIQELGSPLDPHDRRYLLAMPLFHIASLHNLAVPRLATGSAVVMHQGAFDVDRVLRLIEQEKVTNWGAVPTMANRLIEHGDLSGYDLSSLTAFSLSSAPSSPAFQERLRAALPVARQSLVNSYGLTETSTAVAVATPADLVEAPDTLGHPIPTVQIEIRDPMGNPVPDGEEGEICVRSPLNMLGYWDDPDATSATIRADRWLHTGDIGVMEQGRVRISSRRSDLIIRGGENIYPAEIENVLAEHPAVRECIALAVPHADLGQEVLAIVVTPPDVEVSEDNLRTYAAEQLAHFKVPSHWRIGHDPLPRNATGKVIRRR